MNRNGPPARIWIDVDLDAVKYNYRQISDAVHGMKVYCVLKADAYGLGAKQVGTALKNAGAEHFCVAEFREAQALLHLGLPVQILGAVLDFELPDAIANRVILPVTCIESAERISAEAVRQNVTAECQLKIDTGMGRIGVLTEYVPDVLRYIKTLPNLSLSGLYSHFPMALKDEASAAFSDRQIKRIRRAADMFEKILGRAPASLHIANSDAILNIPQSCQPPFTAVRAGLSLYGMPDATAKALHLKPVASLYARLIASRVLPAGSTVGYNRTCKLKRDTLTGTIAAGYADGLPLALSNRGEFLFHGKRCRILGRLSMDYTVISLDAFTTDDLTFGEPVTCLGTDDSQIITADEWASITQTHVYDILTALGPRVHRVYH